MTSMRLLGAVVLAALLAVAGGASTGLARAAGPTVTAIDLGTLGGTFSEGIDVNASGQVVGESATAAFQIYAFSWTQAGGMLDLGTLGGGFSTARDVNASGDAVGSSDTAAGDTHATLWHT